MIVYRWIHLRVKAYLAISFDTIFLKDI